MFDLERRSAVVTGGTGNLGPAVVAAYLEANAHVCVAVRDAAKGAALQAALADQAGGPEDPRLLVVNADPADPVAMAALVDQVMRTWGRLDILANLAGRFATSAPNDAVAAQELWDANVRTALVATEACLRPMRARGRGRIVSVAASAALRGGKHAAGYAMSKSAIVRWTESLAAEVKGEGITVNCVLPGTIDHPANRAAMPKADPTTWASPAEVAAAILFLSSDEASGITGAALPITART
ncbi:MAG: SDR family NAD(P)-dependent oxidoreductase [Candidatus Limnocylindrales bacterium]